MMSGTVILPSIPREKVCHLSENYLCYSCSCSPRSYHPSLLLFLLLSLLLFLHFAPLQSLLFLVLVLLTIPSPAISLVFALIPLSSTILFLVQYFPSSYCKHIISGYLIEVYLTLQSLCLTSRGQWIPWVSKLIWSERDCERNINSAFRLIWIGRSSRHWRYLWRPYRKCHKVPPRFLTVSRLTSKSANKTVFTSMSPVLSVWILTDCLPVCLSVLFLTDCPFVCLSIVTDVLTDWLSDSTYHKHFLMS